MPGMGMQGGMMSGMPGMMGGRGGMGMQGGMPGMMGMPGGQQTTVHMTYMDVDKVEAQGAHLAEKMFPIRMVMVTASFPLKQQLDEFRRAMKKKSLNELVNMPDLVFDFHGLDIERRVYDISGKFVKDWENHTAPLTDMFTTLMAAVPEPQQDDEKLFKFPGVMNDGLAMALPMLAHGKYPDMVPREVDKAIKDLEDKYKDKTPPVVTAFQKKAQKKGVDAFNLRPFSETDDQQQPEKKPETNPMKPENPSAAEEGPEPEIPEHCLVRFMDLAVEPGYTYEYRVKVKMANPNYGKPKVVAYRRLATYPELEPEGDDTWALVPKVTVPYDTVWYATDDKAERDRAQVQIHTWLPAIQTDPRNDKSLIGVGDWTVWDKAPVHRGEYIGRTHNSKVPVWIMDKETYDYARNAQTHSQNVPVDFTVRRGLKNESALLIDYEGGKIGSARVNGKLVSDESQLQLLVLAPDGRLLVHNNLDDTNRPERKLTLQRWKDALEVVKQQKQMQQAPTNVFPGGGGLFEGRGKGN
jgi:hypothetical protein